MFWKLFSRPAFTDGIVDLYSLDLYPPDSDLGFGDYEDFIITEHKKKREIGQISIRMGESEGTFYFGHIGYHIDPPWRGHHYALRACRLVLPLFRFYEMNDIVITCDPDNIPSIRTCEKLGCLLESTVSVPQDRQKKWELSPVKRRYVLRI